MWYENFYMKIELYKTEQKTLSYGKCSSLLTQLKKEKEWLKEPDKFSLQNSLKNSDKTYLNFFRMGGSQINYDTINTEWIVK